MQAKRFHTVDDSFELDWIEVDFSEKLPARKKDNPPFYYKVLDTKEGPRHFRFWEDWIWTPENPKGVWHENPKTLAKQLREIAQVVEKVPFYQ